MHPEKETRVLKERRIRRLSERFFDGEPDSYQCVRIGRRGRQRSRAIMQTAFPILCPDGASHTSPGCKPWESLFYRRHGNLQRPRDAEGHRPKGFHQVAVGRVVKPDLSVAARCGEVMLLRVKGQGKDGAT